MHVTPWEGLGSACGEGAGERESLLQGEDRSWFLKDVSRWMRGHKGNTFLHSADCKSKAWRPEMDGTFGSNWKQTGQWDGNTQGNRTQQGDMSKKQAWLPGILSPGGQPSST